MSRRFVYFQGVKKVNLGYGATFWVRNGDVMSWYLITNDGNATLLTEVNRTVFTNSPQTLSIVEEQLTSDEYLEDFPYQASDWEFGLPEYSNEEDGTILAIPNPSGTSWRPNGEGFRARFAFISNRIIKIDRASNTTATDFLNAGGVASTSVGAFSFPNFLTQTDPDFLGLAISSLPNPNSPSTITASRSGGSIGVGVTIGIRTGNSPFMSSQSSFTGSASTSLSSSYISHPNHSNLSAVGIGATQSSKDSPATLVVIKGDNPAQLGASIYGVNIGSTGRINAALSGSNPSPSQYVAQTVEMSKYTENHSFILSNNYEFELNIEPFTGNTEDYNFGWGGGIVRDTIVNPTELMAPLPFQDTDFQSTRYSGIALNQLFRGGGQFVIFRRPRLFDWPSAISGFALIGSAPFSMLDNGSVLDFNLFNTDYRITFDTVDESIKSIFESADDFNLFSECLWYEQS